MILTLHILTGAAIITKIRHPYGIIIAFLSHYILDSIPHYDYSIKNIKNKKWNHCLFEFIKVFTDIFFAVFIILLLSENIFLALIGGFVAIIPDMLNAFFIILNPQNKYLKIHYNLHKKIHFPEDKIKYKFNEKVFLFIEIFSQILISLISIILIR